MIFPFKKKGFPRKSLCSCVVVLLLCLLKFIHNYIKFFPTNIRPFSLYEITPKDWITV